MVDHSNFSATSGLRSAKTVGQRSCPIGKHLGLRDLPLRSNQGRWSPTAKCSCGLRAPALLPERLALDSLEGASLDLALALADRRGCGAVSTTRTSRGQLLSRTEAQLWLCRPVSG